MPSFVYVLMHVSGKRFKIGKAIDIESRKRALGAERFLLDGSFALQFDTVERSHDAERILHLVFDESNCDKAEVIAQDGIADGATEFFSIECYEDVLRFVAQNLLRLKCTLITDLAEVFRPKSVVLLEQVRAERIALKEDQTRRRRERELRQLEENRCARQVAEDSLNGRIRETLNELKALSTISVRGDEILCVSNLADREALQSVFWALLSSGFSLSEGVGRERVFVSSGYIGAVTGWSDHERDQFVCVTARYVWTDFPLESDMYEKFWRLFDEGRRVLTDSATIAVHDVYWERRDQSTNGSLVRPARDRRANAHGLLLIDPVPDYRRDTKGVMAG